MLFRSAARGARWRGRALAQGGGDVVRGHRAQRCSSLPVALAARGAEVADATSTVEEPRGGRGDGAPRRREGIDVLVFATLVPPFGLGPY